MADEHVDTEKAALPVVKAEEIKSPVQEVPDKMKDVVFSVEDFEPEQLPERASSKEEKKEEKAEIKVEPKVEPKPKVKEVEDPEKAKLEEPEIKVEEKVEERPLIKHLKPPKGQKKEEVKGEVKPAQGRDYSEFSEEEAAALKQMSNPAFEVASKALRQVKELSKLKDSTYLQHDNAFVLDPQYQQLFKQERQAQTEYAHWEAQLQAIDEGKSFKAITGYNAQTGAPIVVEMPPTAANMEKVRLAMFNCSQASQKLKGELQQYPTKYRSVVQTDMQRSQQERQARFPWAKDPSLLEHEITIEGLGDRSIKQVQEDIKGFFPPYMRSHPAMDWVADLYVNIKLLESELNSLKGNKQVEQIKKEEKSLVEPSSPRRGVQTAKKAVNGVKEFVDDLANL